MKKDKAIGVLMAEVFAVSRKERKEKNKSKKK